MLIRPTEFPRLAGAVGGAALLVAALGVGVSPASAAPTWLDREVLSTPAPLPVDYVSPAISRGGDLAVLYVRGTQDAGSDATSARAETTVRPLGGSWSAPQTLTPTGAAVSAASLSLADDGRGLAFWSGGSANPGLFGSTRDGGLPRFGDAVKLSTGTISTSPIPSSAANRTGVAVTAWVEGTSFSGGRRIVARVRDAGASDFAPEAKLSRGPDGSTDQWGEPDEGATPENGPKVAVGADGTVYVAWSQTDKLHSGTRAYLAVRRPGQAAFDAAALITADPTTGGSPTERVRAIAAGPDGTVAVSLLSSGSRILVARRAPAATSFDAPVQINGSLGVGHSSQSSGAPIAIDAAGRITAAFDTGSVSAAGAVQLTQQATAGGPFSAPVALPAAASSSPRAVALDVSAEGDALVAWPEVAISSAPRHARLLVVRRAGPTAAPSAPRTLDERDYGGVEAVPATAPRIAIGPDGDALVGWGWNGFAGGQNGWEAHVAALDVEGPAVADGTAGGTAGVPVALRADATDRFSQVEGVRWAFGDGATATGQDVEHVYAEPGVYAAKLTAVDEHGNERTATRTVTVTAAPKPDPGPGPGTNPTPNPSPGDAPVVPSLPLPGPGTVPVPVPSPQPTASAPKVSGVRIAGRTVSLRTTAAGRLRVELQRRTVTRVRKGGKTVRRTVYRRVQRLTVRATKAGTLRVTVRKLSAGRYRVRVTPLGATGAKTTTTSVRVSR